MNASRVIAVPEGPLVSWYGDDFTGSAAVMEVLAFAGLPSVLFLDIPTPERMELFAGYRGFGIAGVARSKPPAWMETHLPPVFEWMKATGSPILQYKVCSTFDSSPRVGSIGKAIDLAAPVFGGDWHPLLVAAPAIHRYQAFGNLFATVGDVGYRLDRHPTMSRHPVTPMDEAEVCRHLAKQTDRTMGLVDLVAMKSESAEQILQAERERGANVISIDVVDDETLRRAGRLIWEQSREGLFVIGSQGVEYALVEHWRDTGELEQASPPPSAGTVDRICVVSGSASPVTAEQIEWASSNGFFPIRFEAATAVDRDALDAETDRTAAEALSALSHGKDPLVYTALGPDDPAIGVYRATVARAKLDDAEANARLGTALGKLLGRVLRAAGLKRGAISGGDTSSYGALSLGLFALTALAPTDAGAALLKAHSEDPEFADLEIALKGGQMGTPDYFGRIKSGGGPPMRGGKL